MGSIKMAEDIRVTNPVSIQSDAKSRVAFDMMQLIANYEASNERNSREYWLTLYSQCYKSTNGATLKRVLDRED
jgi:hypothetical protein